MIDIWWCDTTDFSESEIRYITDSMPMFIRQKMKAYKFERDQKTYLLARYIIKQYFDHNKCDLNWDTWKIEPKGKPYLKTHIHFNISHCDNLVVVAFSEKEIGIDIENNRAINVTPLIRKFHSSEQEMILRNKEINFFKIWTRKEAFLKAIGLGLYLNLNQVSVVNDIISYKDTDWYIQSMSLQENVELAVCSYTKNRCPQIKQIFQTDTRRLWIEEV